ncbi:protein-disulfide reductase DsbD family protein [Mesoterricola sediminis]|uniref:Thiol:disulfide interchange protein n=1 Tax=Mesoterricola sediminis TaxID=2927980 RepID=A0AA48GT23_9BACT|nr:cytochrome c biogenesis protein CcdA [Mesoterricola sediminis]BDU75145.1 thiol:disulfide interchange protein [Mesoterricola sediminis]
MRRWTAWLLIVLAAVVCRAGAFDPERDVVVAFRKGAVVLTVPAGAHLKAAFMEVALAKGTAGTLKVGPLPPTREKDELGDGIWHDRVAIPVAGEGLAGTVALTVTYQPCTEGQGGVCYPPTDKVLQVKAADIPALKPAAAPAPAEAPRAEPAAPAAPAAPAPAAVQAAAPQPPAPDAGRGGLLWSFLVIFAFGMGASLTPCVYPMIPITMAIIGAKGGGKLRGFSLSMALVLGMAVTYTVLGVLAAKSGAVAGAWAQRPAFLIPVSVLFFLFALSLFGAFEIRLPDALQQKLQGSGGRKGYLGAFTMGMVLGPLSAPCVGPVIGSVILTIAQQGRVALGAAQMFTFALGMGVLFLVTGTFTASLPRSGDWLERFKHGMGLVVLAFAVWNVRLLLPPWALYGLGSAVLLVAAPVLGAFRASESLVAGIFRGAGLLALALGLLCGVRGVELGLDVQLLPRGAAAAAPAPTASVWMEQDLEGALARAKAGGKLVLVDTYADWCAQCKELDEKTWPDPAVQAWIRDHAVAVRINTDATRKDLVPRLQIRSYPTVLLLDAEGRILRTSLGFQPPAEMLRFLKG